MRRKSENREPERRADASPRGGVAEEVILHADEYYILASSPRVDDRTLVLKQGETFAVLDRNGNVDPFGGGALGLYHEGTRFLSRWMLRIFDRRCMLLSSTVKEDNDLLAVDLTNYDVYQDGKMLVPRGTVHVFRSTFLWDGACRGRIRIRNYGSAEVRVPLETMFEADFVDVFEMRGQSRSRRGEMLEAEIDASGVALGYRGLDGVVRRARLSWSPAPDRVHVDGARYELELAPQEEREICWSCRCEVGETPSVTMLPSHEAAFQEASGELRSIIEPSAKIYTSNEQFNHWMHRSSADLHMMTTRLKDGIYPYAGVPWYSTIFGRDGIITGLETLWMSPALSRGVLSCLAATQARESSSERDAEPGKILHEARLGEMAALGEIPFGQYYGTVDATPLFVMLAAAYGHWTGETGLVGKLWPHVELALDWIDQYGDLDGDGFIEYEKKSQHGLANQGWKDSQDSVFHADGRLAAPPIALAEVQAYVYAAKRGAADIARMLGEENRSRDLLKEAEALRERFEDAFWDEELGTYVLALDGDKRPCRVRTSNAGHCLFSGIVSNERAAVVAKTLLSPESFSGWGIRTVASGEVRYNPMSYHNGSVWPHDNAIIAAGLARYGFKHELLKIFTGLFDASIFTELQRLPELFCGFVRRPGEGPTQYPVACSPQAWAAAAPFALLQSCLGMTVSGETRSVTFRQPLLPEAMKWVEIRNLSVADARLDLRIHRHLEGAGIEVLRREGEVAVAVLK